MTTEGQGSAANPVGLGIPVAIEGPWAEPRIYPDVAGILDNPDAAYAKLKEMGKGLFGQGGMAPAAARPTRLGETLGNLLQQGLGSRRTTRPTRPGLAAGSAEAASAGPGIADRQHHEAAVRALKVRVPGAMLRSSRCFAEPGPSRTPEFARLRLCSAPRREVRSRCAASGARGRLGSSATLLISMT